MLGDVDPTVKIIGKIIGWPSELDAELVSESTTAPSGSPAPLPFRVSWHARGRTAMVSREPTGALRTILPAAALGLVGVLGVTGCSAGQVTQTDSIEPAVNGNTGQVGDISLRDVRVAYPEDGSYEPGDEVALQLTIVNDGDTATALESVSSDISDVDAELLGNPSLPGRFGLHVVVPEEPTGNEAPETSGSSETETSVTETTETTETTESAPETSGTDAPPASETSSVEATSTEQARPADEPEVGTLSIVFTGLLVDLPIGRNVPVTFRFADGSEIEIALPIAAPTTVREEPPADEEGGH